MKLDVNLLPAEAWRPIEPLIGRSTQRVSEREFARIPCRLRVAKGDHEGPSITLPVTLWDFSQYGFAVLRDESKTASLELKEGDRVRFGTDLGKGWLEAECVVRNLSNFKGRQRIGLARLDLVRANATHGRIGVPKGEYLRLPESVQLRAETAHPVFFGEWAQLKLTGLQPWLKMEFTSNEPSLPLFRGQTLEIRFSLPSSGDNRFRGEIETLEKLPGGLVRFRMNPLSLSTGLANDLAELLACDGGINPDSLKRFGFPMRFFRNRISFRFVETMEDYEAVLQLRRNAYVEVGKRTAETAPEEMSIAWDKASRILCAFHEDRLVASAAITFPASETDTLRSETAFPGNRFPGNPPPKTELLEVNSLCTHRDFRRGDLLHAVFEQIARIFILSDRNYIMNLSDSRLLPMYLGIGFKDQKVTGTFLGIPHHLIKIPREAVTRAKGLGLLRWNALYGDLMEDVLAKGMLPMTLRERLTLRARLALKPLASRLRNRDGEQAVRRYIGDNRPAGDEKRFDMKKAG
jgi:hypothetical protein